MCISVLSHAQIIVGILNTLIAMCRNRFCHPGAQTSNKMNGKENKQAHGSSGIIRDVIWATVAE